MIAIGAVIPKRTRARYSPAPPGVPAREEASDGDRHRRSPLRAHGPGGDAHAQPPREAERALRGDDRRWHRPPPPLRRGRGGGRRARHRRRARVLRGRGRVRDGLAGPGSPHLRAARRPAACRAGALAAAGGDPEGHDRRRERGGRGRGPRDRALLRSGLRLGPGPLRDRLRQGGLRGRLRHHLAAHAAGGAGQGQGALLPGRPRLGRGSRGARPREPRLPARRLPGRGAQDRRAHRARAAGQLPLHEGEREPVTQRRLPHRARPRGRDAPPLRPDRRPSRGRRRLPGEARAALSGPLSAMHIRQIALVARELAPVVADLTAVLGIEVGFRDPGVAEFGLHNAVMPVGQTFLEVVSPVREGTTAGRLLDRRGGDGGYMVILQTADLPADRARLAALGVRIVWQVELDDIATVHLHPRDLGGAIVSLDQPVPPESWRWGGPQWRAKVRTEVVRGIASVTIQADDPPRMAARWAEVLGLAAPRRADGASTLALSPGAIRFVPVADGRGEGVCAFGVTATNAERALAVARARGLPVSGRSVAVGGVRVEVE